MNILLRAQKYANDAKTPARNIYFIAVYISFYFIAGCRASAINATRNIYCSINFILFYFRCANGIRDSGYVK